MLKQIVATMIGDILTMFVIIGGTLWFLTREPDKPKPKKADIFIRRGEHHARQMDLFDEDYR